MQKTLFAALTGLIILSAAFFVTPSSSAGGSPKSKAAGALDKSEDQGSAQNEGAEAHPDMALEEVQSAAEAFIKAFNNLDWEPFRNCFADDATVFFPSATMAAARANGRAEIEAIFKTLFDAARKRKDSPPYLNIEPKDTRIRVSGNAAVVTFHLGGKDSLGRRTIIFEKLKGRWLIVHLHASTMAL